MSIEPYLERIRSWPYYCGGDDPDSPEYSEKHDIKLYNGSVMMANSGEILHMGDICTEAIQFIARTTTKVNISIIIRHEGGEPFAVIRGGRVWLCTETHEYDNVGFMESLGELFG